MRTSASVWSGIAAVALCMVGFAAAAGDPPPMPAVKKESLEQGFPPAEKRRNHEGSVLMSFYIDQRGRPNGMEAIETSSEQFSEGARRLMQAMRFKATKEWIAAGGPAVRYRYGFIFELAPCAHRSSPWGGDLEVVSICASALPGTPPPTMLERH